MVGGVKAIILLLVVSVVLVGGCASTPVNPNWVSDPSDRNNVKIEKEIRGLLENPEGELTKADLEKVKNLYLRNNQLTDVTALKELTQLTYLNLERNQLTDVTALKELTQLTKLYLDDNRLTDITALKELTQLKTLWLSENQLTDVKGLEKLTLLKELHLQDNPDLTKAQIAELQKALPKCRILHRFAK